jgi:hypothetical protein
MHSPDAENNKLFLCYNSKEINVRFFTLLFFVIMLSGCTATYKQNLLSEPNTKLDPGKAVVIATPINGSYGSKEYPASGKTTVQVVRSSFAQHTNNISVSIDCSDLTCFQNLKSSNFDYYVIPEILHWEDRATEWSGISDKIEVKISIYEYPGWKEFASAIIKGKSKWAAFGGDHPQDLLPDPLYDYIESLY